MDQELYLLNRLTLVGNQVLEFSDPPELLRRRMEERLGSHVVVGGGLGPRRFRVHWKEWRLMLSAGRKMPLSVRCNIEPAKQGSRLVCRAESPAMLILACLFVAVLIVFGIWMLQDYADGRVTPGAPFVAGVVVFCGVASTFLNMHLARSAFHDLMRVLAQEL